MELILIVVFMVAALAFNVTVHRYHLQRGHRWHLDRFAKAGALAMVVVFGGGGLLFGMPFLVAVWPFAAIVAAFLVVVGIGGKLWQDRRDGQTWAARLADFDHLPPAQRPSWVREAQARQAQPKQGGGLFGALDRWLG